MDFSKRTSQLVFFAVLALISSSNAIRLFAELSRRGIKGNVTFEQQVPGGDVQVEVRLAAVGANARPGVTLDIGIFSSPVDYSSKEPCHGLGDEQLVDLNKYAKSDPLSNPSFTISTKAEPHIEILGAEGTIWGRTLRVRSPAGDIDACGAIQGEHEVRGDDEDAQRKQGASAGPATPAVVVGSVRTRTVRARFRHPIGGSVWFRSVEFRYSPTESAAYTLIYSDLYDVSRAGEARNYPWALYATEPRPSGNHEDASGDNCKDLLNVYDPLGKTGTKAATCTKEKPDDCALGELHARHGDLKVGHVHARFDRRQVVDRHLTLPELGARVLYLVFRDPDNVNSFYACAKLTPAPRRVATAAFSWQGVSGSIELTQDSPFEPTLVRIDLTGLEALAGGFHVHQFPVPPKTAVTSKVCADTGGHYNPFKADFSKAPQHGDGTDDEYEVGDLSGKHGFLTGMSVFENGTVWDTMLPLWGPRSVIGRSIVIHKAADNSRWVCATLLDSRPMTRAVVLFKFPFVGTIELRQAVDEPDSETTIFIESLVYSDVTTDDTADHKWHVHVKPPASFQDSINWEKRCVSAGPHYNPFAVSVNGTSYDECSPDSPEFCEVGDLAKRWGTLKIVVDKARRNVTRYFFSDTYLPLSGRNSVLDKSIVVHADEHPNRGNRLACSKIVQAFRHKGVIKEWGSDDDDKEKVVEGSIEFTQDSRYDPTTVKVKLDSLGGIAGGYHVHVMPVQLENRFPCMTTGPHWNPFNVSAKVTAGTPGLHETVDRYEVGDLSGKHGPLNSRKDYKETLEDWNLPLYGNTSIMGRSVVVHKLEKGARWSCGTIGWGFSPAEATQRSAVASFHHPHGFIRGYIRFRQIIYKNGFETETFIEVNLKHLEPNENKQTHGHNWAVFNAIAGSDAAEKAQTSRCRSAGVRWSPIGVETKQEKYDPQCGQDLPLRCQVGDMSGKLGPLSIGGERALLSDSHYPLEGTDSGMQRKSVVVFDENGSAMPLACAEVQPDDDVIRTVVVQRSSSYSQSAFMREVREILGAPEWFVVSDMTKSKTLHNDECEQLSLRFMGPKANQLSDDFNRLFQSGSLASPTMLIPGLPPSTKRTLSFKQCSKRSTNSPPPPQAKESSAVSVLPPLWTSIVGLLASSLSRFV